jgi:hypothetical protein
VNEVRKVARRIALPAILPELGEISGENIFEITEVWPAIKDIAYVAERLHSPGRHLLRSFLPVLGGLD